MQKYKIRIFNYKIWIFYYERNGNSVLNGDENIIKFEVSFYVTKTKKYDHVKH